MRNMSFMLTTEQIRSRTKTVTRRLGWKFLNEGDLIQAVEKCQGLKKGQKVKKLCVIKITSVSHQRLCWITDEDVAKEGFPDNSRNWFIDMFCKHNKCSTIDYVMRIEFEYIGGES